MKAVVITRHGDGQVLEVRDVAPPPPPEGNQVSVRVRASALNRADILQRQGRYPAPPGFPPDIPGMEFAGEVAQVGDDVSTWKKGDRVFGITGGGAQAEYLLTPENHLAAIPPSLDWTEAAAVPEVFITAHDALFTQASLQEGETVLIHAAGSGVGTAAIQLATARGAKAFGTARSAGKLDRAKQFGLSNGIAIENDPLVVVDAVRDWTEGRGVDVILDLVGAARGYKNVFYATIGTGIGTGIVLDGKMFHGRTGAAAEGGHVSIDYRGPVCGCGKPGCIEVLASGSAIARRAREKLAAGATSAMISIAGNVGAIRGETVGKALLAGDRFAKDLIMETIEMLALWLANMIDLLDPEVIVIGGGAAMLYQPFYDQLHERTSQLAVNPRAAEVPLLSAHYGADSGIAGGAALCT